MSNIFKSNSRFSSLIQDISEEKNNSKKSKEENRVHEDSKEKRFNSFAESRFRGFNEKEREEQLKRQKELKEREKERINKELLKIENFPDLVPNQKKEITENNTKITYIEKLQKEDDMIKEYNDKDLENLKPGWVLLKSDPLTGRTIFKQHPETFIKEKKEKTDEEIMRDIINTLSDLHEKRTREYIENYGYDEWERMFKFPDWREREAYLESIENQSDENENENEYEYDYEDEEYNN